MCISLRNSNITTDHVFIIKKVFYSHTESFIQIFSAFCRNTSQAQILWFQILREDANFTCPVLCVTNDGESPYVTPIFQFIHLLPNKKFREDSHRQFQLLRLYVNSFKVQIECFEKVLIKCIF